MPFWMEQTLAVALVIALLLIWSLYHRRWAEREAARRELSQSESSSAARARAAD